MDNAPAPEAHVVFPLEVDEDGWPPVASERVWAFDLGNGLFRIDNAPWFVRDLAVGDVVLAHAPDSQSNPVFERLVERSEHITIRLVVFRAGPLAGVLQPAVDAFAPFGVYAEGAGQYGLVALDVPPSAPLSAIHSRLLAGVRNGSWDWEEGRISPAWEAATGTRDSR